MRSLVLSFFTILLAIYGARLGIHDVDKKERAKILQNMVLAQAAYPDFDLKRLDPKFEISIIESRRIVMLAYDRAAKELVISGPGTNEAKLWVDNIALPYRKINILGLEQVAVHKGMMKEAKKIYRDIKGPVTESLKSGYKVTFAGHSRFGPVAGYLLAMVYDENPMYAPQLSYLSKGAPPAGDETFVNRWNEIFPDAINVYDENDPVEV